MTRRLKWPVQKPTCASAWPPDGGGSSTALCALYRIRRPVGAPRDDQKKQGSVYRRVSPDARPRGPDAVPKPGFSAARSKIRRKGAPSLKLCLTTKQISCIIIFAVASRVLGSSSGLGHRPLTAVTGVRLPYRVPCRNGTKDSLFRFLLNSAQAPLDAAKCGHALRSARRWQALVRRAGAPFLLQLPLRCATICITGRNDGIGRRDGLKIRW